MWGSSWSVAGGLLVIGAVILAALLTAWTPIFAILIALAAIPVIGFLWVGRRAAQEAQQTTPEETWAEDHASDAPTHDVNVGGGMVSDRERAAPQ
jgi:hypothetical protein